MIPRSVAPLIRAAFLAVGVHIAAALVLTALIFS